MRENGARFGRVSAFENDRQYGYHAGLTDFPASPRKEENKVPQIIFFAAVGVAAYVGYRSFVKEAQRVTAKVRRAEKQAASGATGTLVQDPETGEYRLAKD